MKCRVKDSDIGNTLKQFEGSFNATKPSRIMKWCKGDQGVNFGNDRIVNQNRRSKIFTAMNDSVSDAVNLRNGIDYSQIFICNQLRNYVES